MPELRIASPVGTLTLVGDVALTGLAFAPDALAGGESSALLDRVAAQLDAYFGGRREMFDIPLNPTGTDFQLKVWNQLCAIPFGQTISYGELARRVGNPNASRAVGLANGKNPIAILIPCHRVIGADGSLTGFGGGLACKKTLLDLEQRSCSLFNAAPLQAAGT